MKSYMVTENIDAMNSDYVLTVFSSYGCNLLFVDGVSVESLTQEDKANNRTELLPYTFSVAAQSKEAAKKLVDYTHYNVLLGSDEEDEDDTEEDEE